MPNSGLDAMLDSDRIDDLARLYRLFIKVSNGLPTLRRALRATVIRRGQEINEVDPTAGGDGADSGQEDEAPESSAKGKGKAKARPPTAAALTLQLALKWVQDVLNLKDKFDAVWSKAFRGDRDLESGINEARSCFPSAHIPRS